MKIYKGGAWRTITGCRIFKGGVWRRVEAARIYKSSAWRLAANYTAPPSSPGGGGGGGGGGTITLAISPTSFSASGLDTLTVTTGALTATPSGGLAPYTYSWTVSASTGSGTNIINSRTSASTTLTVDFPAYGTQSVTLSCVATDTLGTTQTATVSGTVRAISSL